MEDKVRRAIINVIPIELWEHLRELGSDYWTAKSREEMFQQRIADLKSGLAVFIRNKKRMPTEWITEYQSRICRTEIKCMASMN